jgi:hypothetical protein
MNIATAPVATKQRDVKDFKAADPPAIGLKQPAWIIWILWVAASIVGFALSAAALRGSATILPENTPLIIAGTVFVLGRLLLPTLPAFLHWLILRRLFARAGWWIPASVVGWLLAYIPLNMGIAGADTGQGFLFISERYVFGVACAVAGAVAGTMQWLVLRRWVSCAGWWVLASSISWVGAAWVFANLTRGADVHFLLGGAASGSLSGAITGVVLVWLLRHPRPANADSVS